jgi:hypothetical protein
MNSRPLGISRRISTPRNAISGNGGVRALGERYDFSIVQRRSSKNRIDQLSERCIKKWNRANVRSHLPAVRRDFAEVA